MMCKLSKTKEVNSLLKVFFSKIRNYDDDFEDEDEGAAIEQPTTKRIGLGNVLSPPQRLGLNNKANDIDERWKD